MNIIEINQENLIVCDNPDCDYVIKNETGDPYIDAFEYIDRPCPKCGCNLLSAEDYLDYYHFLKLVKWINKWFGWMGYLSRSKRMKYKQTVKIHEGIHLSKIELNETN